MIRDYESWGFNESRPPQCQPLAEALDPSRMVAWYNRQTQEIQRRLQAEQGPEGNKDSALKLQTLLNTWTSPKFAVTASLNIEAFDGLAAATKQYAEADLDWKHHGFLAALYDNITQAVSKLEASGMVGNDQPEEQPDMGGGAPASDFGPTDEPPPGGEEPPPAPEGEEQPGEPPPAGGEEPSAQPGQAPAPRGI